MSHTLNRLCLYFGTVTSMINKCLNPNMSDMLLFFSARNKLIRILSEKRYRGVVNITQLTLDDVIQVNTIAYKTDGQSLDKNN